MRAGCLLVASSWAAAAAMMLFAAGFVRTSCGRAIGTGRQSVILLLKVRIEMRKGGQGPGGGRRDCRCAILLQTYNSRRLLHHP